MGMRSCSQDANGKREQRLSAARPCTANGIPLWQNRSGALTKMESVNPPEAASCEPLRIQRHMADTLRTVDEVTQRLRHRALGM